MTDDPGARLLALIWQLEALPRGHRGGIEVVNWPDVEAVLRRNGCACRCCDHSEGSDCACECHRDGLCAWEPDHPNGLLALVEQWRLEIEPDQGVTWTRDCEIRNNVLAKCADELAAALRRIPPPEEAKP